MKLAKKKNDLTLWCANQEKTLQTLNIKICATVRQAKLIDKRWPVRLLISQSVWKFTRLQIF